MTFTTHTLKQRNPLWFRIVNLAFLLPCVVWPIIFFTTIFIFDNSKSLVFTLLLFVAINAYPVYLVLLLFANAKLFKKNRLVATTFPILFSLTFLTVCANFFGDLSVIRAFWSQIGSTPQDQINYENVIGYNYTKDSIHIYYRDTLVKDADLGSFALINFHWAKDRNTVYFKGKPVPYIDSKTFRHIGYGYAIDKSNVYYNDQIIANADAYTFEHISGTQNGKDKHSCYSRGKKVDCSLQVTPNQLK